MYVQYVSEVMFHTCQGCKDTAVDHIPVAARTVPTYVAAAMGSLGLIKNLEQYCTNFLFKNSILYKIALKHCPKPEELLTVFSC